jgi:hypothetical protein
MQRFKVAFRITAVPLTFTLLMWDIGLRESAHGREKCDKGQEEIVHLSI